MSKTNLTSCQGGVKAMVEVWKPSENLRGSSKNHSKHPSSCWTSATDKQTWARVVPSTAWTTLTCKMSCEVEEEEIHLSTFYKAYSYLRNMRRGWGALGCSRELVIDGISKSLQVWDRYHSYPQRSEDYKEEVEEASQCGFFHQTGGRLRKGSSVISVSSFW